MTTRSRWSDEIEEMTKLLTKHGYRSPRAYALKLAREGIGPYELEERLRYREGVGSLQYTHGFQRALPGPARARRRGPGLAKADRDAPRRRRSRTREEYLSSLRWNVKDAKEALHNAVEMSDWRGVKKYTAQLEDLERRLTDAEVGGRKRGGRLARQYRRQETRAEQQARWQRQEAYQRAGRRGIP